MFKDNIIRDYEVCLRPLSKIELYLKNFQFKSFSSNTIKYKLKGNKLKMIDLRQQKQNTPYLKTTQQYA